jgi:hypothetical protein
MGMIRIEIKNPRGDQNSAMGMIGFAYEWRWVRLWGWNRQSVRLWLCSAMGMDTAMFGYGDECGDGYGFVDANHSQ